MPPEAKIPASPFRLIDVHAEEDGPPPPAAAAAAAAAAASAKPSAARAAAAARQRLWLWQAAVAATQLAFVVGSVILKAGLRAVDPAGGAAFHPVVYAFYREAAAGPLLLLLAWATTGTTRPAATDAPRLLALGACMFAGQLCYIWGLALSGVVAAACMQPAIPVFTAMLSIALRAEAASPHKVLGIALAAAGAVVMIAGGGGGGAAAADAAAGAAGAARRALGNAVLLANALAMAGYYIVSKRLVAKYPPASVAAWGYLAAAALMGSAAAATTERGDWRFPPALYPALGYWVAISVAAYALLAGALRALPASTVASFQCLQPVFGFALAATILRERPAATDAAGAACVVAGLALVARPEAAAAAAGRAAARLGRLRRALGSRGSRGALVSLASLVGSQPRGLDKV
jgi:drug/metabolite transporter (DMT)-like permease